VSAARPAVAELAEELHLPTENLLTPSLLRQLAWDGTANTESEIRSELRNLGARQWQVDMTTPVIARSFVEATQGATDSDISHR
jgi:ribonuclease D